MATNIPIQFLVRSGGQTGADLGALLGAIQAGFPVEAVVFKGFVPKGRSHIPYEIPVVHLPISGSYKIQLVRRTRHNVDSSDATLVFHSNNLEKTRGTKLTVDYARRRNKPCLLVDLRTFTIDNINEIVNWISENVRETLNVAGERVCNEENIAMIMNEILGRIGRGKEESQGNPVIGGSRSTG